jgi:hypothetical protein
MVQYTTLSYLRHTYTTHSLHSFTPLIHFGIPLAQARRLLAGGAFVQVSRLQTARKPVLPRCKIENYVVRDPAHKFHSIFSHMSQYKPSTTDTKSGPHDVSLWETTVAVSPERWLWSIDHAEVTLRLQVIPI